jgi:hypothetical protein
MFIPFVRFGLYLFPVFFILFCFVFWQDYIILGEVPCLLASQDFLGSCSIPTPDLASTITRNHSYFYWRMFLLLLDVTHFFVTLQSTEFQSILQCVHPPLPIHTHTNTHTHTHPKHLTTFLTPIQNVTFHSCILLFFISDFFL